MTPFKYLIHDWSTEATRWNGEKTYICGRCGMSEHFFNSVIIEDMDPLEVAVLQVTGVENGEGFKLCGDETKKGRDPLD